MVAVKKKAAKKKSAKKKVARQTIKRIRPAAAAVKDPPDETAIATAKVAEHLSSYLPRILGALDAIAGELCKAADLAAPKPRQFQVKKRE